MTEHKDIVVTWPKALHFATYLSQVDQAEERGLLINYRVHRVPTARLPHDVRLYRVYDGYVRGYTPIVCVKWRREGEVVDVVNGGPWPAGCYLVCRPYFVGCKLLAMKGFRGWRYFDRTLVGD
jgi:hypothetical protein